ncbi:SRPBCC family protein [Ginsengibacter hankyongi]|nr:SRPBCC family protein [Ginsengibacter hankyongi]
MRRAKLFFIAVLILIGFLCLITVFLPSQITISKWVTINANDNAVATQINDFNNWKNWYPAFQNKEITVNISEQDNKPVAILTNENKKEISLSLLKSSPENIIVLVAEEKGNTKTYQFVLLPNGTGQTQLTWNVNMQLGWYPWRKFAGIFLDKVTGPKYEAALQNLKIAAEKNVP